MKHLIKIIVGAVIIMVILIFFAPKNEEKYFRKVELNTSIRTINLSGVPYLDTVVNVGASIIKVKDVNIIILPLLPEDCLDTSLLGYIEYRDNYYIIRLNAELDKKAQILTISHELIHLLQDYSGRFILNGNYVIFDGEQYSPYVEYLDRPWEKESFYYEHVLETKINKKLY
jgi:hypothetical protein